MALSEINLNELDINDLKNIGTAPAIVKVIIVILLCVIMMNCTCFDISATMLQNRPTLASSSGASTSSSMQNGDGLSSKMAMFRILSGQAACGARTKCLQMPQRM